MFNIKDILKEIKPSVLEEKAVKKAFKLFLGKIKKDLVKEGANAVLGGSISKGTWLRGNHDIDVFVQFKDNGDLSTRLFKILEKNFSNADKNARIFSGTEKRSFSCVERVHGSRDYFHLNFSGFDFEIVPVFKIKNVYEAKNITDCSVFHIKWVINNSSLKMRDEIRLVKQFCKSAGVYGAETHIAGFSGYVVEILTIYFGGFLKFVKGISKLDDGIIIDISKHKKNLDRNKLSPVILIDPVQGDRNAAAALSSGKFEKLKKVCLKYLKKPSKNFFVVKGKNIKSLKKKFDFVFEVESLDGKRDVVGTKVLKVFEFIKNQLDKEGFVFSNGDWEFDKDKSHIWFNVKNKKIKEEYVHYGPVLSSNEEFLQNFREKYKGKNVFVSDKRLAVVLKKEDFKIEDFAKKLINSKYVSERVKSVKRI